MPTKYLATPLKGRVGKSRQVQPVQFEIDGPHSADKIKKAITSVFYKYCYHAYVVFRFPDVQTMVAELYADTTDNHLATITIEEIED